MCRYTFFSAEEELPISCRRLPWPWMWPWKMGYVMDDASREAKAMVMDRNVVRRGTLVSLCFFT
jgi:hypothetical protein